MNIEAISTPARALYVRSSQRESILEVLKRSIPSPRKCWLEPRFLGDASERVELTQPADQWVRTGENLRSEPWIVIVEPDARPACSSS
jgi:hypothetical protein